jgi:recombination endonuclease VII
VTSWSEKPCAGCGRKKSLKYKNRKFCYRCGIEARRARSKGAHSRAIEQRYGITGETYDRLYELQGGRCAICRRSTGRTRRLAVDHDHKTTLVRGLLCRPCNSMLGLARDDPEFFRRAIDYLAQPPMTRLDIGPADH